MTTILTIPDAVVPDVREGLFCLLGDASQGLDRVLVRPGRERHAGWFADVRSQLEDVLTALDLIGWDGDSQPAAVTLDLGRHGQTLKTALDSYIRLLEYQEAEADIDDARRASEGRPPIKPQLSERLGALRALATLIEQQPR